MPSRRHRRPRFDPDEKFSLPSDTDPDEVLRRLMGIPGPVESHEEAEDPDKQDEATDS
jgi:hypothetical protein